MLDFGQALEMALNGKAYHAIRLIESQEEAESLLSYFTKKNVQVSIKEMRVPESRDQLRVQLFDNTATA